MQLKLLAALFLGIAWACAIFSITIGETGDDWVKCRRKGGVLVMEIDATSFRCAERPAYIY